MVLVEVIDTNKQRNRRQKHREAYTDKNRQKTHRERRTPVYSFDILAIIIVSAS